jgi:hypothetical protein
MEAADPAFFHKLYGVKKTRIFYSKKDFLDYVAMIGLCVLVLGASYGVRHVMAMIGYALCALALVMFVARHGIEWRVPAIARRPEDLLYMLVYKLQNLKPMYFVALGVLLLENALIAATPSLPHHVELMRTVGVTLFYVHLLAITAFRTAIFIDHLIKRELVREVLIQTPWKRVINDRTNITLEIIHAYGTGLLTHIVLIAPWYLVVTHASFSAVFLPVTCAINIAVQLKWMRTLNAWFYRDHWVGHNSELEFLFLHGTHHDAIPSGMIAVAGNGFLEGFMRFTIGAPVTFYNPIVACVVFTFDVKTDIELHQYIPGVFPYLPKMALEIGQHSTHHFGKLEPYSLGLKLDQPVLQNRYKKAFAKVPDEIMNSLRLDEELTDFEWDNPTHRSTLVLWEKYQKRRKSV